MALVSSSTQAADTAPTANHGRKNRAIRKKQLAQLTIIAAAMAVLTGGFCCNT
jgi:hypothetical protein